MTERLSNQVRLLVQCERCNDALAVFVGHLLELPQGMALVEAIAQGHDRHRCKMPLIGGESK